jgi:hypothetical protein
MLRSIGRVVGDVAVDGGAEYVWEPRLPEFIRDRASALEATIASIAATAQNVRSGRRRRRSMDSSSRRPIKGQAPILVADAGILRGIERQAKA